MKRVSTTETLSIREQQISRLIAWGYVQKEIADTLSISIQTVAVHLRNIYSKLDIHKETDLTRYWIFREYCIADNFRKSVVVIFFLALTSATIITENNMVRSFRSPAARAARGMRGRTRRFENLFDLALWHS